MFAEAANDFFTKKTNKTKIINDLYRDLITLYRTVKHHPEKLHRQFKYALIARGEFERLMQVNHTPLTDIQRAARYLYLQRTAFDGRIHGRNFGTSTTGAPGLNLFTLQGLLEDA